MSVLSKSKLSQSQRGYRLYHSAGATTLCFILEQFKQFYRTLSKTETILGYGLLKALYLIIKLQR